MDTGRFPQVDCVAHFRFRAGSPITVLELQECAQSDFRVLF